MPNADWGRNVLQTGLSSVVICHHFWSGFGLVIHNQSFWELPGELNKYVNVWFPPLIQCAQPS